MDRVTYLRTLIPILVASVLGTDGASSDLTTDLVAHWMFEEGSGTAVADSSGNGNHGTLFGGAAWTTGWSGGGIEFDGIDSLIEVPDSAVLNIQDAITLAAWIKVDDYGDRDGVITKGTTLLPYSMQLRGARKIRFAANIGDPPSSTGAGTWECGTKMGLGGWHHVAVTYDGVRIRFYIDGVIDLVQPTANLIFGVMDEPLIIGANLQRDAYFDGVLDDVRVYSRALTEGEIAAIAENVAFTDSNLPIVVIDTEGQTIPDDPKVDVFMGIIDNGPGVRNTLNDPYSGYEGRIGIEVRGSSSIQFTKKSFAFETRYPDGSNRNVQLLGMPTENDWVLHGPYTDKTLVRNVLAYGLARDLGWYASRTRFCELVVNGDYRGVYVLMEKLKQDDDRIDISELFPHYVSGDSLTGGYVFKIDRPGETNPAGWDSPFGSGVHYEFVDPNPPDLAPEQAAYLEQHVTAWETVMDSSIYNDPFEGYYDWIDVDSFVDFMILNELAKNVDGYILSHYFHKDRDSIDGRIVAGPVWDFNLCYGNANYRDGWLPDGWELDLSADQPVPFWWFKLRDDPVFWNRLSCRWQALRSTVFAPDSLATRIAALTSTIDEARVRNFERWPVLGEWVWPNWFIGATFEEEVGFMTDWIQNRVAWIDGQLTDCVSVVWAEPGTSTMTGAPDSTITAPIEAWIIQSDADSVVFATDDPELVVTQSADSVSLRATALGPHTFRATAFDGGTMIDVSPRYTYWVVEPVAIAINEINYNSAPDFDPEDWVELFNFGDAPIDLSGWIFKDEDDAHAFVFPAGTILDPTAYVVACRDSLLFRTAFPGVAPVLGNLGFGFSGAGELLRLYDDDGILVDWVVYDDAPPWPPEPDGNGPTLELVDPLLDNTLASSWASSSGHGSPGAPNVTTGATVAPPAALELSFEIPAPNPFNPTTRLRFTLPDRARVRLSVHDVNGRLVQLLLDEVLEGGRHEIVWNAKGQASGVYYAQIRVGGRQRSRRIVLVR